MIIASLPRIDHLRNHHSNHHPCPPQDIHHHNTHHQVETKTKTIFMKNPIKCLCILVLHLFGTLFSKKFWCYLFSGTNLALKFR